jgi:hypothetical protein
LIPFQTQSKPQPMPFSGWAFEKSIELDWVCPNFLATTYNSRPAKRQAVFLTLAALQWENIEALAERLGSAAPTVRDPGLEPLAEIARALIVLPAKAIVSAVLGSAILPNGLMGTLARLGPDPLGPSHQAYRDLIDIFTNQTLEDRARAKVLMQLNGPVGGAVVQVVRALDPVLLHPNVLSAIHTVPDAIALNHALAFIRARCSKATDEYLRASIKTYGSHRKMTGWVRLWVRQADLMPWPSPIPEDDTAFVPLSTASALIEAGERLSLCLETKIPEVALGRYYYLEYRPEDSEESAVIELRRVSSGWVLEGSHGPKNRPVPPSTAATIRQKLLSHGVLIYDRASGEGLGEVARLFNIWDFDRRDGDFDLLTDLEELETEAL